MPGSSHLEDLYEAVFGAPPSHTSRVAMQRMEAFLGLKAGDPFSRMLIVQLRCADEIGETRSQLQAMVDRLVPLLDTARLLTRELDRSSGDIARRNRRIPAMQHAVEMIDVSRPLPLLAYLGDALRLRSRYDDLSTSERISAARWDAGLLLGLLLLAVMAGVMLQRFLLVPHG